MSDDWDTGTNGNDVPKALREYAERQKTENAELRKELGKMQTQMRQSAIGDVLKEKGFNAKIANLFPNDIEPTAEKVQEWLTTYGDVFGGTPEIKPEGEISNPEEDARSQALTRVGAAVASELPPDKIRNLGDQIDNSTSKEDLDKILAGSGVKWSL